MLNYIWSSMYREVQTFEYIQKSIRGEVYIVEYTRGTIHGRLHNALHGLNNNKRIAGNEKYFSIMFKSHWWL